MKRLLSILACTLVVIILMTACGKSDGDTANKSAPPTEKPLQVEPIDAAKVTQVTATDAMYSSYLYVVEDKAAIKQLVDLYNGLTYTELEDGEEAPDLLAGTLYSLFYLDVQSDSRIASCYISPEGYVMFDDFEHPYRLVSEFDETSLKQILADNNTLH